MPKKPTPFDDKRARIAALASATPAVAAPELHRFLTDKNGYLAGDAAAVAARLELRDLVPDMEAAFLRLVAGGAAADKGCHGKRHLLEALLALDADAREAYRAGVRCVQREPAFGGAVDTAAPVRALSAQALVNADDPTALAEIAPLLADPEPLVRAEAANALGRSGLDVAGPVLHLKALAGDTEPDVLQRTYGALLRIDPRRYLPVVTTALAPEDTSPKNPEPPKPPAEEIAEAAALALGESRLPEAFAILKKALDGEACAPRSVLMAIALLRSDEALALLFGVLEDGPEGQAAAALAALALHRHDEKIVARARRAVEERGSRRLHEALEQHLGA